MKSATKTQKFSLLISLVSFVPKSFFLAEGYQNFLQTFHKTTLFLIDKGHPYMTSFFGILISTFSYVFLPLKSLPLIKRVFALPTNLA